MTKVKTNYSRLSVSRVDNKAVEYARAAVRRGNKDVPRYVKKQCRDFLKIADGKDKKYTINEDKVRQIENILKILVMPKGLKAGESLYSCTCGYQWLFYIAVLAVVYRDDMERRRYETAVLEICRKNFKTYTIAAAFIILILTEPSFSKFFSVAPDGTLSRLVKEAITETLKASPMLYMNKGKPRFKILRDSVKFLLKDNEYIPLNYSTSRLDGRLPSAFLADEVGALDSTYPIEAMRSGQVNIKNKLACIISTKYENSHNPFEIEVGYAKRVLDGLESDETVFSLLFEPDNIKNWATDDTILRQANPVSLEIPEIWDDLIKKRARAIVVESSRQNFLTKHCNIIYQGLGTESFVDINDVQKCRVDHIEWDGREVFLGVDLSMSNDNCAVAMVSDEDGKILADVVAFIPEGRLEEKNKLEKIDYRRFIEQMKCIACGYKTVDYGVIEKFVFDIEKTYRVRVLGLGYDRFNAMSSAQKWEKGIDGVHNGYNCVVIRQHSDTLHPPTKLLAEKIAEGDFIYERNDLLEINFENARCVFDTNLNRYVNKKRSNGKVDMVVALINAIYLLQQDNIFHDDFVSMTI